MYGICHLSSIPIRAEVSEKSELATQLLFGEAYQVVEKEEHWIKIKTCDCGYEGWLDAKLLNPSREEENQYLTAEKYFVKELVLNIRKLDNYLQFPIFAGSSFPFPKNNVLTLGEESFMVMLPQETTITSHAHLSKQQLLLVKFVSQYLESPYLWGGRTPAGIDCSGLVQIALKSIGIALPRDASQQALIGDNIDFMEEAKAGDLAFFQNNEGNIIHTGIILGNNTIIHSSGKVRIDALDQTGIFNKNTQQYTHFLRVIKRVIPV
ncbi:MAG: C40 family peptidase [Bacteroidales bacterium]|jgi:hypothetical protein|nr:C40 family peptidase [Bacteroidales bacterium]